MANATLQDKRLLCEAIAKYSGEAFAPKYGWRDLAIYLLHMGKGLSITKVAEAFQVDRGIVSITCQTVEDGRDDKALDDWCEAAEACLLQVARCRALTATSVRVG